jgi:nucleoside-diphosphate-sugar epimerase
LVTGGAGFIGSNLVRALVQRAADVVVFDNLVTARSTALIDDVLNQVTFIHGDIRCPEDFARIPAGGFDVVVHLAASFANELSTEYPAVDHRTNVEGTLHTLAHARERGCGLFVYAGSSSSYGDAPPPFHEDGPIRPLTPYAVTKHLAEEHVRSSGLPFAIFRLFNVYGPGDLPGRYRNAVPNMVWRALHGDGYIQITGAQATRDFTFVDDVVGYFLQADRARGQIVNIGTGREIPVIELARGILRALGLAEDRIRLEPARPWDRVVRRAANVERLQQLFERPAATTLEAGLPGTVKWLASSPLARASSLQ